MLGTMLLHTLPYLYINKNKLSILVEFVNAILIIQFHCDWDKLYMIVHSNAMHMVGKIIYRSVEVAFYWAYLNIYFTTFYTS